MVNNANEDIYSDKNISVPQINDDTLHITAKEFQYRYNENLLVVLGSAGYNKFKINGMQLKTQSDDVAYQFDTAFPMLAFQDKNNDNISVLMVGANSRNNDMEYYLAIMRIVAYSLCNDNIISRPDDIYEVTGVIQNLIKQATSKDMNTTIAEINRDGVSSESAETNYRGNKFSLLSILRSS